MTHDERREKLGPSAPIRIVAQVDMPGGTMVNRDGYPSKDNTEIYAVTPKDVVKGEEFEPSFYGPALAR